MQSMSITVDPIKQLNESTVAMQQTRSHLFHLQENTMRVFQEHSVRDVAKFEKLNLDKDKIFFLSMAMEQIRSSEPPPLLDAQIHNIIADHCYKNGSERVSSALFSVNCWSSRRLSDLVKWRNPEEQNNTKESRVRSIITLGKKIVTEFCLPLLTVTALVEVISYTTLIVAAKLSSPLSQYPIELLATHKIYELNSSAQFTVMWTIVSIWDNLIQHTLPVSESDARDTLFRRTMTAVDESPA